MWPEESVRFSNRHEAGVALGALVVSHLKDKGVTGPPLIIGLSRGGVPVAAEVALATGGDLDVLVVSRVGLPWQPDFSVGAIADGGPAVIDHDALARAGLSSTELTPAIQRQRVEIRRRLDLYRQGQPAVDIAGRHVIVVDDGVNTGITARAALRALRAAGAEHLAFATPVCAADSSDGLSSEADALLHVQSPTCSSAFGLWYKDFGDVTDESVTEILHRSWTATASTG